MIDLMNENQRLFADFIRRYDEMTARLAAAEKVVEAVTVLIGANWNDADGRGRGERDAVVAALTGYRKAYSDKACDECGGSGFVEGAWGASGEGAPCPRGCKATDLNSGGS